MPDTWEDAAPPVAHDAAGAAAPASARALRIDGLRVTYPGPPPVRAIDDLSLSIEPGECLGILGESGSGKTTLAMALLGLLPDVDLRGTLQLGDLDLRSLDEKRWRDVRWRRIALGFQSPAALNPVLRIGAQLTEPLRVHLGMHESDAKARARAMLESVGLGEWAMSRYPRELSGGQKRLVLIGMALICDPEVIILDEPTAGLDPATRARVVEVLSGLRKARDRILVIVSHDPEALQTLADHVAVLYRGWLAEIGPAPRVLLDPRNPYSFGLLNAHPTLATVKDIRGIRGEPPNPTEVATGCPFYGRCTQAIAGPCTDGRPPYLAPAGEDGRRVVACVRGGVVAVITARDLSKRYRASSGMLRHDSVAAVDCISLEVREGEVVGLVGATGAGKSTLSKLLVRLLDADAGTVELEGADLLAAKGDELKQLRRRVQLLFQDPYEALSPRMTIAQAVREPLDAQDIGTAAERDAAVRRAIASVRLPADDAFLGRHTHELSGGQLQRVALARALVVEPKLLVADEPVAMLDPSEQTKVLQLLKQLQVDRGMAMVLVSHDLAIVLRAADRVLVLDAGRVVEEGSGTQLLTAPQHPATRLLLDAAGRRHLFGANGTGQEPAATSSA
jgi:peptide/nickel transport system ATP-binding protein